MPIDTSIYANAAPRSNIMNTVVQAYNLKDMLRRSKQAEELAPFQKREAEARAKTAEQSLQDIPAQRQAQTRKAQIDEMTNGIKALAGTFGAANSQEDWDMSRQILSKTPMADAVANIPPQFTPELRDHFRNMGMSAEQIATQAHQNAMLEETKRHNMETEKLKEPPPTDEQRNFDAAYADWRGGRNLGDTPAARAMFRFEVMPKMKDKSKLLTPEEEAQYARLHPPAKPAPEPGSYIPLTDDQGRVTGAWNPKAGNAVQIPPELAGSRKNALPASTNAKIAEYENSTRKIVDLEKSYKPAFIGPIEGRYEKSKASGILSFMPFFKTPEGYGEFAALNADLKNSVIKLITGAQMGQQEAERILQQVPVETDKPEIWEAKYKTTKANAEFLLEKIKKLSGIGGVSAAPASNSPQGGKQPVPDMKGKSDDELMKILMGK